MATSLSTSGVTFPDNSVQASAARNGASIGTESSSALTLTASSGQYQVFRPTSAANAIVNLPNATTLAKGSEVFVIDNRSPIGANVLIKNASGTVIGGIPEGSIALVNLTDNSTSAGVWVVSQTVWQNAIVGFDNASVTTIANSPLVANWQGIVGLTSTTFVRWWMAMTNGTSSFNYYLYTQVGTISGSTITLGSVQTATVASTGALGGGGSFGGQSMMGSVIRLSSTSFVALLSYQGYLSQSGYDGCGNYYANNYPAVYNFVGVSTVSGTTVTFGSFTGAALPAIGFSSNNNFWDQRVTAVFNSSAIVRLSDTSFATAFNDGNNNTYQYPYNYSGSIACQVYTVSGTTITAGTKVQLATSTYTQVQSLTALSATSMFLCYAQAASAGGTTGRTKMNVISVSGTVPTFGTSVNVESSDTTPFFYGPAPMDGGVAPSSSQAVFNAGYFTGVASISGTTPTFVSGPYQSRVGSMYLTTSSRAIAAKFGYSYLDISASGFAFYPTQASTNNSGMTATYLNNPLGAQPTTALIFSDGVGSTIASGGTNSKLILGTAS